jgi:type VI secretion system protein ImpK
VHMAGELFYQYLEQLMARPDALDLADMLEVFSLCMLLGFKGRYTLSTTGSEVLAIVRQLASRIEAMRGVPGELSPQWRPSEADIGRKKDAWIPRLAILAVASLVLAIGLFGYYTVSLRSGAAEIRTETSRLSR